MKEVRFSRSGTQTVHIQFLVKSRRYWYESNIQPVVDVMIDSIPAAERYHDRKTRSWEIAAGYWPSLRTVLEGRGFQVLETEERGMNFRELTREHADVPFASPLILFAVLLSTLYGHLFHAASFASMIRPLFSLALLLCCFFAVRFRSHSLLLISMFLLFLFNPIWPVHIGNWWLWQLMNWVALVILFIIACFIEMLAKKEREAESLSFRRPSN